MAVVCLVGMLNDPSEFRQEIRYRFSVRHGQIAKFHRVNSNFSLFDLRNAALCSSEPSRDLYLSQPSSQAGFTEFAEHLPVSRIVN